jgi:nucleolar protein 14
VAGTNVDFEWHAVVESKVNSTTEVMGGSQLKQLKTAISTSGLSNQSAPSRKRKRGNGAVLEHRDKRTEKLKEIHEKFNPFDVKVEKLKHDVGGRKIKGVMGKPSASKQAGIEQVWLCLNL